MVLVLFLFILAGTKNVTTDINSSTGTTIYWMQFHWVQLECWVQIHWTYKWKILNKLILSIKRITFLMIWLKLNTLLQLVKNGQKSLKSVGFCYIRYITTKSISDCESTNSVNLLCFIINKVNWFIEEKMEIRM